MGVSSSIPSLIYYGLMERLGGNSTEETKAFIVAAKNWHFDGYVFICVLLLNINSSELDTVSGNDA